MYFVNQSKKKKHLIKLHIIFLVNYKMFSPFRIDFCFSLKPNCGCSNNTGTRHTNVWPASSKGNTALTIKISRSPRLLTLSITGYIVCVNNRFQVDFFFSHIFPYVLS